MRGTWRRCWAHSASPDPSWEQTKGPGRAVLSGSPGHPRPTPLSRALPQSSLPTRPYCGAMRLKDSEEAPSAPPVWFPQTRRPGRGRGGAAGRRPSGAQSKAAAEGPRGPLTAPGLHVHSQLPQLDAAVSHRQTEEPQSGGPAVPRPQLLALPGESQEARTSLGETRGSLGDGTGARERAFLCLNFLIRRLSLWEPTAHLPVDPGGDKVLAGVGQRCLTLAVGAGLCVASLREGRGWQGERRPGG